MRTRGRNWFTRCTHQTNRIAQNDWLPFVFSSKYGNKHCNCLLRSLTIFIYIWSFTVFIVFVCCPFILRRRMHLSMSELESAALISGDCLYRINDFVWYIVYRGAWTKGSQSGAKKRILSVARWPVAVTNKLHTRCTRITLAHKYRTFSQQTFEHNPFYFRLPSTSVRYP